jgi:hypothetical protein
MLMLLLVLRRQQQQRNRYDNSPLKPWKRIEGHSSPSPISGPTYERKKRTFKSYDNQRYW